MFDRLFSDLRTLQTAHQQTAQGVMQEWVRRNAAALDYVRHDFVDDDVARLVVVLRLPVEFTTMEGFLAWRSGVGWTIAASRWGVVHLLMSADTYEVIWEDGSKNPCLVLLHLHTPHTGTPP